MTILIVDDEPLSVDSIADSLSWDTLGIEKVYKAYSLKQAQEVFSLHTIDILLCDIEMPRGNGIELVEWIRKKEYDTVCIFLTSFSRFEYASSAIKLQIFDYVLKPCEYSKLTKVIANACHKVKENHEKKQKELSGVYWLDSCQTRTNQFWHELLISEIPSDLAYLKKELEWRHLDSSLSDRKYYLLLLILIPGEKMADWKDEFSWKYALNNIITELLTAPPVLAYDNLFSVISPEDGFTDKKTFYDVCKELISTLKQLLPAEFIGYCSPACKMEEVNAMGQLLRKEYSEKYSFHSTLFLPDILYTPHQPPNFSDELWQNSLMANHPERILYDLENYFARPSHNEYFDNQTIQHIYHQLVRVTFNVLKTCSLSMPKDLINENQDSKTVVYRSISEFLHWARHIVTEVAKLISSRDASDSAIGKLIKYIQDNISSDLNRTELTQIVHLHPDYLSALFHQQTGLSLSEYITSERLKEARRLLLSTDLPVNEIAIRTGFPNISYFSKIFKKETGSTPLKYRKMNVDNSYLTGE